MTDLRNAKRIAAKAAGGRRVIDNLSIKEKPKNRLQEFGTDWPEA